MFLVSDKYIIEFKISLSFFLWTKLNLRKTHMIFSVNLTNNGANLTGKTNFEVGTFSRSGGGSTLGSLEARIDFLNMFTDLS